MAANGVMGLGRVKTSGGAESWGAFEVAGVFLAGYTLIAAISGRAPIMLITMVML